MYESRGFCAKMQLQITPDFGSKLYDIASVRVHGTNDTWTVFGRGEWRPGGGERCLNQVTPDFQLKIILCRTRTCAWQLAPQTHSNIFFNGTKVLYFSGHPTYTELV